MGPRPRAETVATGRALVADRSAPLTLGRERCVQAEPSARTRAHDRRLRHRGSGHIAWNQQGLLRPTRRFTFRDRVGRELPFHRTRIWLASRPIARR
jgi:hypothetical protein